MIYKRTFSFTDDDEDIIYFLDNKDKGSRSAYIASLIRADMNKTPFEEMVRKIVVDELGKRGNSNNMEETVKQMFDL